MRKNVDNDILIFDVIVLLFLLMYSGQASCLLLRYQRTTTKERLTGKVHTYVPLEIALFYN